MYYADNYPAGRLLVSTKWSAVSLWNWPIIPGTAQPEMAGFEAVHKKVAFRPGIAHHIHVNLNETNPDYESSLLP